MKGEREIHEERHNLLYNALRGSQTCSVTPQALSCDAKSPSTSSALTNTPTHAESFPNNSVLSGFYDSRYDGSVFLLTHSSDCGRLEAALAERAQQGRLAHAGVAHQDHLKEPVRGLQCSFSGPLQATRKKEFKSGLD